MLQARNRLIVIRKLFLNVCMVAGVLAACAGCQHTDSHSSAGLEAWRLPGLTENRPAQDNSSLQFAMARSLEAQGDPERATILYEEILQRTSDPDAHWRLGLIQSKRGQLSEAATHFRSAIEHRPNNADLYCDLGYSLYLQRHWADSEASLRKAITIDPRHQRSHMNLGLLMAQTRQLEKAEQEFLAGGCSREESRSNVSLAQSIQRQAEYQPATPARHLLNADVSRIQPAAKFEVHKPQAAVPSSWHAQNNLATDVSRIPHMPGYSPVRLMNPFVPEHNAFCQSIHR